MDFKIPDTPEELFRQGQKKISHLSKWIPFLSVCCIVLFFVLTSFYQIAPNEVGLIRRFGKYVRPTTPGLHWKLPFNIEKLNKVAVTTVYTEEFGFRTLKPGIKTQYSSKSYSEESLMLTGDLNVIDIGWAVLYKVKDPVKALFNIRELRETVRDVAESVMRQVVGDRSVDEVLTTGSEDIKQEVRVHMQKVLDDYKSGIQITSVELQSVNPPENVKTSFTKVDSAKQEKEQVINLAWGEYNKKIPRAKGEAQKSIKQAEGYALKRTNEAQGDAVKFLQTWEAYKSSKDVTRQRLYLETMGNILPSVKNIYIIDPKSDNILPLLNLKKE